MAQTPREIFVEGLRTAHAMEAAAPGLAPQLERLGSHPEIGMKVAAHFEETTGQLERIEGCRAQSARKAA